MATYTNPADFAAWPGARQIAEACTPKGQPVAKTAVVDALLRGNTPSGTGAELEAGQACVANCQAACNEADIEIDAVIVVAGYAAPMSPAPALLTQIGKAIALFYMHSDLRINSEINSEGQHPIHARYKWAQKQLEDIRNRKLSLGPTDPNPPSSGGGPAFFAGERRLWARKSRGHQDG